MIGTMMMLNNFFYPGLSHFSAFRKLLFVLCLILILVIFTESNQKEMWTKQHFLEDTFDNFEREIFL